MKIHETIAIFIDPFYHTPAIFKAAFFASEAGKNSLQLPRRD
jgi:hypothetical protein